MFKLLPLVAAFSLFSLSAARALDATEVNTAFDKFFAVLDVVAKDAPTVKDAAGVARLLESWSAANNDLTTALKQFAEKNPAVVQAKEPPAELTKSLERLQTMGQAYPGLGVTLGSLAKQYETEPDVKASRVKFQRSVARLQEATTLEKK